MTTYNFTTTLKPYGDAPTAGILEIDPVALYGYFEMRDGSEGGGLWFDRNESGALRVIDYDAVFELSTAVIKALDAAGIDTSDT